MSGLHLNPATEAILAELTRDMGVDATRVLHVACALLKTVRCAEQIGQAPALVDANGRATHVLTTRAQYREGLP